MPDCETQEDMFGKLVQRSTALRSCVANGDLSRSVKASPSKRRSSSTKHLESSQKRPKTQPSPLPLTYQFNDVCGQSKWNSIHDQSSESLESLSSIPSSAFLSTFISSYGRLPELKVVRSELADLLAKETEFHPNIDFLFKVDPERENKVNAAMRDEAVFNLRFLHMYFQLSTLTFVQAVSLIDRFIVKVKVKPKYMACVATACYHIAAMDYEKDCPKADELVLFSRCGGTASDLLKMEQIIKSKPVGTNAITILNFLQALVGSNPIPESVIAQLQVVLCSVRIHTYRPVTVAFALLSNYNRQGFHDPCVPGNRRLKRLLRMCQLTWAEITDCANYLQTSSEDFYARSLPSSHRQMVWALSRRTLYNLSCSSPPALVTITEDEADGNSGDEKEKDIEELMSSDLECVGARLMSVDEEVEEDEEDPPAATYLECSSVSVGQAESEDDGESWLSRLFDENWILDPRKGHAIGDRAIPCTS